MTNSHSTKFFLTVFIVISGLIILYVQGVSSTYPDQKKTEISFKDLSDRSMRKILVGDKTLTVEVVSKSDSITQGLSGRSEIGSDGMLFVLPQKMFSTFWMKDMHFDLDIIWITDGAIVKIDKNVPKPQPDTPANRLATYPSDGEVEMVLELDAGAVDTLGLLVGQRVQLVDSQ